VDEIVKWMHSNNTDPEIVTLVKDYLRQRGNSTMQSIASPFLPSKYHLLVKYHDKLGWKKFLEERFFSYYVQLEREYISTCDTYQTAKTWVLGFMEHLIRITHRQWLHRNAKVHFKQSDGRKISQHEQIMEKIEDLLWTDPDDLLDDDKALLDKDFE
jgi:hypothetical protein